MQLPWAPFTSSRSPRGRPWAQNPGYPQSAAACLGHASPEKCSATSCSPHPPLRTWVSGLGVRERDDAQVRQRPPQNVAEQNPQAHRLWHPTASQGHAAALPVTEVAPGGPGAMGPTWQRLKMSAWVTCTLKCLSTAFACCRALREQSTRRQRPAPTWARSCREMCLLSGGHRTQNLPRSTCHPRLRVGRRSRGGGG